MSSKKDKVPTALGIRYSLCIWKIDRQIENWIWGDANILNLFSQLKVVEKLESSFCWLIFAMTSWT